MRKVALLTFLLLGLAFGAQARHHERKPAAQIGRLYVGGGEFLYPRNTRDAFFGRNIRAHTHQFGRVHEAVFKNIFAKSKKLKANPNIPNIFSHKDMAYASFRLKKGVTVIFSDFALRSR